MRFTSATCSRSPWKASQLYHLGHNHHRHQLLVLIWFAHDVGNFHQSKFPLPVPGGRWIHLIRSVHSFPVVRPLCIRARIQWGLCRMIIESSCVNKLEPVVLRKRLKTSWMLKLSGWSNPRDSSSEDTGESLLILQIHQLTPAAEPLPVLSLGGRRHGVNELYHTNQLLAVIKRGHDLLGVAVVSMSCDRTSFYWHANKKDKQSLWRATWQSAPGPTEETYLFRNCLFTVTLMPTAAPGNIFAFNMPTWIIDADISLKELLWNKRLMFLFPIIDIWHWSRGAVKSNLPRIFWEHKFTLLWHHQAVAKKTNQGTFLWFSWERFIPLLSCVGGSSCWLKHLNKLNGWEQEVRASIIGWMGHTCSIALLLIWPVSGAEDGWPRPLDSCQRRSFIGSVQMRPLLLLETLKEPSGHPEATRLHLP